MLLTPDYRCVPAGATVWAQVVQCEHFAAMGPLRPVVGLYWLNSVDPQLEREWLQTLRL